jgi:DNA-binding response OmpR family regulator
MSKPTPRILHVEDDQDFQNFIGLTLKDRGDITQAATLEEASRLVKQEEFDLILLDLTLPDGSGMELINQLPGKGLSTPIVIFSAHDVTDTVIGADYSFVKGHFLESDLADAVDILLSKSVTAV